MTALYLIVRLAGERIALPAERIESVAEIGEIEPVPLAPPHIAGLFALRSRVLTVVDGGVAAGGEAIPLAGANDAVIVMIAGHCYALLVEAVEDAVEAAAPAPPPQLLGGGWAQVAIGLVQIEDAPMLVVDPALLVDGVKSFA